MSDSPLKSLAGYSRLVAEAVDRATVERSTLAVWPTSPYTGVLEGEIFFSQGLRLRVREELDFEAGLITAYGYEFHRGEEKLCWYDDFPHPGDPSLASTFPHHKHVPPEVKRNRVPAPGISFTEPNLPAMIQEAEALLA